MLHFCWPLQPDAVQQDIVVVPVTMAEVPGGMIITIDLAWIVIIIDRRPERTAFPLQDQEVGEQVEAEAVEGGVGKFYKDAFSCNLYGYA